MKVLVMVSLHIKIKEIKRIYQVLDDLIKENIHIQILDIKGQNILMEKYFGQKKYFNYSIVGNRTMSIKDILDNLYDIDSMIIIGLNSKDYLTKYINKYIGTNTNIFVLAPSYGVYSDATILINDGAYLMSTIYDLKIV